MPIVIDANVVIACVTEEPHFEELLVLTARDETVGPASLPFEIGNALTSLFKKRKIELDDALGAYKLFEAMPIRLIDVNITGALQISHQFRIYAYDAYIIQCAIDVNGHILSLDRGLKSAARLLRIPLIEVAS